MGRTVYLNGQYMPEDDARISPFDRGFLFADGVYEVTPVVNGKLLDAERMMQRLENSLASLGLGWPMEPQAFLAMHEELIVRNKLREGMIYAQITRGVAERDFPFPPDAMPTVFAFPKRLDVVNNMRAETGVAVALVEELRWKRRDVKSVALLGQVLARQAAVERRAAEGWMVEDGLVTEGTASSAFIVKDGVIITSPLEVEGRPRILPGIRRAILLEIAEAEGIPVELKPFSPQEAQAADEAFMSAATFGLLPVVDIDGVTIGDGKPGPVSRKLRELYFARLENG